MQLISATPATELESEGSTNLLFLALVEADVALAVSRRL